MIPVKIVLVDDDEGHAELIRLNLERSGFDNEITHFTSGRKAFEFLLESVPNDRAHKYLVLLDINMPGWDGHQVLERIRSNERTRFLPVIVLTTAHDESEIELCYALGCNFYMPKPIQYERFSAAMRELGLFIQNTRIPNLQRPVIREAVL